MEYKGLLKLALAVIDGHFSYVTDNLYSNQILVHELSFVCGVNFHTSQVFRCEGWYLLVDGQVT